MLLTQPKIDSCLLGLDVKGTILLKRNQDRIARMFPVFKILFFTRLKEHARSLNLFSATQQVLRGAIGCLASQLFDGPTAVHTDGRMYFQANERAVKDTCRGLTAP